MKYRLNFIYQNETLNHDAMPKDEESLEFIPAVGDTVEFKCHSNDQEGETDIGLFSVSKREFSYGHDSQTLICDVTIFLT